MVKSPASKCGSKDGSSQERVEYIDLVWRHECFSVEEVADELQIRRVPGSQVGMKNETRRTRWKVVELGTENGNTLIWRSISIANRIISSTTVQLQLDSCPDGVGSGMETHRSRKKKEKWVREEERSLSKRAVIRVGSGTSERVIFFR